MVLIHGGTCTAHNYDISPEYTASSTAEFLGCPVVSINRPDYADSSPLPDVPEDSTYHQVMGKNVYHEHLFPALWEKFGKPAGASSMVLNGHSMGVPSIVIAAALHAQEKTPAYPLSGIILSGWGCRLTDFKVLIPSTAEEKIEWKNLIMLSQPEKQCVDPAIRSHIPTQDHPMRNEEGMEHWTGKFAGFWRKYSDEVTVPIMFANGEHDVLWEGSMRHAKEYETMFPKCPRFDGGVVLGAPHAIEWSYYAAGWYARCFGFAVEVAASHALSEAS